MKLKIKDCFIDPVTPDAPEVWDIVTLSIDVLTDDYKVIRSRIGKNLIYIIKYEATGTGEDKRWSKMHRVKFNLFYKKGGTATSPLSDEENVEYPTLLPDIQDPYYWLYNNYKHPDPAPPEGVTACDLEYAGALNKHRINDKNGTWLDLEQIIKADGETVPPEETENRKLKNYIKTNLVGNDKKATYLFDTFKLEENGNCTIDSVQRKISLRSLGIAEENVDNVKVIDAPVVLY